MSLAFPYSVGAAYVCFKSIDYTLFRASKELLYIPLSFDVRFRSKEFIDVFGYRGSKGVASGYWQRQPLWAICGNLLISGRRIVLVIKCGWQRKLIASTEQKPTD